MTIGAFARSTGLSAKALRGYDELGLLRPASVDPVDAATHRRLAVELFNRSWRLLDLPRRTPEQDDELVHVVHASCHHWREIGSAANLSRGENQCARVYAALDRGEAERYAALADAELAGIADPDDREVIAGQLAELGL